MHPITYRSRRPRRSSGTRSWWHSRRWRTRRSGPWGCRWRGTNLDFVGIIGLAIDAILGVCLYNDVHTADKLLTHVHEDLFFDRCRLPRLQRSDWQEREQIDDLTIIIALDPRHVHVTTSDVGHIVEVAQFFNARQLVAGFQCQCSELIVGCQARATPVCMNHVFLDIDTGIASAGNCTGDEAGKAATIWIRYCKALFRFNGGWCDGHGTSPAANAGHTNCILGVHRRKVRATRDAVLAVAAFEARARHVAKGDHIQRLSRGAAPLRIRQVGALLPRRRHTSNFGADVALSVRRSHRRRECRRFSL